MHLAFAFAHVCMSIVCVCVWFTISCDIKWTKNSSDSDTSRQADGIMSAKPALMRWRLSLQNGDISGLGKMNGFNNRPLCKKIDNQLASRVETEV